MKNTKKKVILSVCLAALFACIAVVSGVMLALNLSKSESNIASLATTDPDSLVTASKMKLTSDVDSITPGGTFTVHVTFTSRSNRNWDSLQALLVPVDTDGNPIFELCQYFKLVSSKKPNRLSGDDSFDGYTMNVTDKFDYTRFGDEDTGLFFSMFTDGNDEPTSKNCEFEATVQVLEGLPIDEDITFNLNIKCPTNFITTTAIGTPKQKDYETAGDFSANDLKFGTRNANTKAEIDSIKFELDVKDYVIKSQNGAGVEYCFDTDNYCEITLDATSDLDLLVYYPTMKEDSVGATVKAGATASKTAAPATLTALTEDGVNITVSGTNRYLYILATPEDGNTANVKVYTVQLTFTYARLSNLTATSTGFADTSITKCDLDLEATDGVFDPDTFAYTAFVPEGTTDTTVTPTLAVDYGTSTSIKVVKDGAYQIVGNKVNVNSEAELYLRNIENNDKLSFELTAQDGSKKTYEITFEIVTTDTSLKEVIVIGNPSGKEIPNNADKVAEDDDIDYFYSSVEDEVKITITPNDGNAKVEIAKVGEDGAVGGFENYDPDKVYDLGEYIIKVTASAGNSEEYTLVLEKFDGFRLKDGHDFDLIALVADINEYSVSVKYRRTYTELGWTHGLDDLGVSKYVLGEIVIRTKLSGLVDNFSASQAGKICVYMADETLIYDGANGGIVSGYADENVCTGWKIVYGSGSTADIIYVSVLGDVDCDGLITTTDGSTINGYVIGRESFDDLEVRLAAHVENDGFITTTDAADLNTIIIGTKGDSIEDYFRANA